MAVAISPRGCSRAFIIRVLMRAESYVNDQTSRNTAVSFPFPNSDIESWLAMAREDCLDLVDLQEAVGGTMFQYSDPETYWCQSSQFLTWWKNNVERKSKFQGLVRDADSCKPGVSTSKSKRSFYCRVVVALTINIRNHFSKLVAEHGGLVQVVVPTLQNTHPTLERFLVPTDSLAPDRRQRRIHSNSSENSLEGLDLLSHTISSQGKPLDGSMEESRARSEAGESEMDESDVLGMGGLLSLRKYNPEAAAVTFCENIYNRSIPPGSSKDQRRLRQVAKNFNPFKDFGFQLIQKDSSGPIIAYGVLQGYIAYSLGIRSGDVMTHVDGVSVEGRSVEEVRESLAGKDVGDGADFFSVQEQYDINNSIALLADEATGEYAEYGPHEQDEQMDALESAGAVSPLHRITWLKRRAPDRGGRRLDALVESVDSYVVEEATAGRRRPRELDSADLGEMRDFEQLERIMSSDVVFLDADPPEQLSSKRKKSDQSVSSLGCCRGFIACVLARALDHVKRMRTVSAVSFPFPTPDIANWLKQAAEDCVDNRDFQFALGGTQFNAADASTYWTSPSQFLTWWKNNVERKAKLNSLRKDASSCQAGEFGLRARRALYCRIAVALATNIRNHFDRVVAENKGSVLQVPIPTLTHTHPDLDRTLVNVNMEEKEVESIIGEEGAEDDTFKAVMFSLDHDS